MGLLTRTILIFTLGVALSAIFAPAQAYAKDGWTIKYFTYTTTGLGVKYKYRNRPVKIEIVYSDSAGGAGNVAFVCASKQLMSRVSTEPGDIYAIITNNIVNSYEFNGNSRRTFRPEMTINGEKTKKTKWIEDREDRMVIPLEYKPTALLYNSVLKGETVHLKRKKKFDMDLNLPPADDNFKAFGSECGIGKYK